RPRTAESAREPEHRHPGLTTRLGPWLVVGSGGVRRPRQQAGEVPADARQHVMNGDVAAELGRERGDAGVVDAAGDEAVVPREVDVAVQGEAVHGDTPADPDAEGGDLALGALVVRTEPHATAAGHARRLEAEVGADGDQ